MVDRKHLRDLEQKATPPPWTARHEKSRTSPYWLGDMVGGPDGSDVALACWYESLDPPTAQMIADMDFIAANRNALPRLLAIAEAAGAVMRQFEGAQLHDTIRSYHIDALERLRDLLSS